MTTPPGGDGGGTDDGGGPGNTPDGIVSELDPAPVNPASITGTVNATTTGGFTIEGDGLSSYAVQSSDSKVTAGNAVANGSTYTFTATVNSAFTQTTVVTFTVDVGDDVGVANLGSVTITAP